MSEKCVGVADPITGKYFVRCFDDAKVKNEQAEVSVNETPAAPVVHDTFQMCQTFSYPGAEVTKYACVNPLVGGGKVVCTEWKEPKESETVCGSAESSEAEALASFEDKVARTKNRCTEGNKCVADAAVTLYDDQIDFSTRMALAIREGAGSIWNGVASVFAALSEGQAEVNKACTDPSNPYIKFCR